ncbi:uncharacterized protein LOC120690212 [Panicum virgatum]|uniref:Uncharacterized protein n=1 Tax=Panicum virgatum TaxID=38727 RepID=A0A8T0MTV1_PANVG|nr:uncharacterized protein LOC120690212 [Panicum virgatum]KAG2540600.1 hypothetical protein PVAP13_9NG576000 [Panicum virgatum]
MAKPEAGGAWAWRLLAEDFSAPYREDRFCVPCAAAFCDHCCGAHHRGQGRHEVVVLGAASASASSSEGAQAQAQPGAAHCPARSGVRDSFCVSCGAGFSAALCGAPRRARHLPRRRLRGLLLRALHGLGAVVPPVHRHPDIP